MVSTDETRSDERWLGYFLPLGARWAVVPLLALLGLTAGALVTFSQVSPVLEKVADEAQGAIALDTASIADRSRTASAVLIWAAGAIAVAVALVVAVSGSLLIGWEASSVLPSPRKRRFRMLLVVGVAGFGAAMLIGDRLSHGLSGTSFDGFDRAGILRCSVDWFSAPANALTVMAIASLFAASSSLMVSAMLHPESVEQLAGRLQWLLILGAIATVLGVIEVGALHRMPAAAVTGVAARANLRPALERAVDRAVVAEATPPETPPETPIMSWWAMHELEAPQSSQWTDAIAQQTASSIKSNDADAAVLRSAIVARSLEAGDEAARKATASAMEAVAAHVASFWGIVFTMALGLMYLPAAVVIARASGTAKVAQAVAVGFSTGAGSRTDRLIKPFLRLVATLAPLLVGAIAELLTSWAGLFESQ